jgi:hypothetical protein
MGLPKNYRKSLNINPPKIGFEARQQILNNIANKGTYLPKSILHEDMDRDFIEYVKNSIKLTLGGQEVPVIFLSIQRWAEFAKTWKFSDENKNIKIPFITIVRKPDAQVGTNYSGTFNIPGKPTFTYMKIPTWDGNIKSFDIYKIPQPVSIDMMYEVRLFCNRMRDLNIFNKKMLESFSAGEKYLRINGHPIPLLLDSIGDESVINSIDERKYYVQLYSIKMLGYLLDEEEFEVAPAISRAIQFYEITQDLHTAPYQIVKRKEEGEIELRIQFDPGVNVFNLSIDVDSTYSEIEVDNINTYVTTLNGTPKTLPFDVEYGDVINITITKTDVSSTALLILKGKIK